MCMRLRCWWMVWMRWLGSMLLLLMRLQLQLQLLVRLIGIAHVQLQQRWYMRRGIAWFVGLHLPPGPWLLAQRDSCKERRGGLVADLIYCAIFLDLLQTRSVGGVWDLTSHFAARQPLGLRNQRCWRWGCLSAMSPIILIVHVHIRLAVLL